MIVKFGESYFFWDTDKTKTSFYEASDRKHTLIRWMVIVLLIVMGAGILAWNLDDLRAYEWAAREPILVEAEISVADEGWWTESYMMYLSYSYDGVDYEGVRYMGNQNPATPKRAGEKLTIALDPRDPGKLAMRMVNSERINGAVVMLSAGLGLLAYFLALRSEVFRCRREEKAARDICNQGKPDYILDTALFVVPILVLFELGMGIIFPAAYGIGPFLMTALPAIAGIPLYFTTRAFRK